MEKQKVVILGGGEGTRLREETEYKPKPMVSIGGLPILWHIMKIYSHYGFRDFIICLGYKGDIIKQFFLTHELMHNDFTISLKDRSKDKIHRGSREVEDWNVTLVDTGLKTQTGARVKRIEKYIDGDEFLVTYGDGLSDIDIPKEIAYHRKMGVTATLAGVHPHSKFGLVQSNAQGMVEKFQEKPVLADYVNGGFYVFQKDVFDWLDPGEGCVLETEPFYRMVEKKRLAMYRHDGFWHSMDTYKDYLDLNKMWDSGVHPWKKW